MSDTKFMQAAAEQAAKPFDKPSFGDIPIQCVRASATNPRKIFAEDHLIDLAASIVKHGVAQPILVRPRETDEHGVTFFEIVAGERRFRASKLANMPTVPAIVRDLSDLEALEIQVIENLQRQDLHPLEEAEGYEVLMKASGFTAEQMADKVGKSKAYIYASLKLCALEPKPRRAFYDGLLTKSTALLVARIPVKKLQEQCVEEITKSYQGIMSTRQAADHIERQYMLALKRASFKPSDTTLIPQAGSCDACPKRTGNQPEIFSEVAADVCTDPVCFKSKGEAHVIRIKQLATANGQTVFSGAEAKKIMPSEHSSLRGGYVDLDKINYDDEKRRTYRKILGNDIPATSLLQSPHSEAIIEVIKISDITDALKEKGVEVVPKSGGDADDSRAREKAQEAAAKVERAYRTKLFTELHHASVMINLVDEDLRLLAKIMYTGLPGGTIPTKLVMSLYGWDENSFTYPDREAKLDAAINGLSPAELNQLIRDCALSHDLHVNVYTAYKESDKPQRLLAMAKRAGVDAKAIQKEVKAAAQAKIDAKHKGAQKKAAKAPPSKPLSDLEALAPEAVPEFIKAHPERLNELAVYAMEKNALFIAPIETTAAELGYEYTPTGWVKLVEEQASTPTATAVEVDVGEPTGECLDVSDTSQAPVPSVETTIKVKAKPVAKIVKAKPKAKPNPWPFPKSPAEKAAPEATAPPLPLLQQPNAEEAV